MEKQKQYRMMMAGFVGYIDKQTKLQDELRDREAKQGALDEAALRAEVLGEPDVKGKRETAESNAARVGVIKGEIEKSRRSAEILDQEMKKIVDGVMDEIRAQHRPNMEKAYRSYIKTLREAAAAEVEIQRVEEEATEAARSVGITSNINLEPTGGIAFGIREFVGQAVARAKLNDYDAA